MNRKVHRHELRFNTDFSQRISEVVAQCKDEVNDEIRFNRQALFKDSPFLVKQQLNETWSGIV